jgi:hypothetical protein
LLQGGFPEGPNSLRAAEPHQLPCAVGGVVVVCGVGRGHTEVPGPRNRRDESAHPVASCYLPGLVARGLMGSGSPRQVLPQAARFPRSAR